MAPVKTKPCNQCKETKPLAEFYKHPQMADKHLNKCIACVKSYVAARIEVKKCDPEWLKAERARCREKTNRARAKGAYVNTSRESRKRWLENNPDKRRAQITAGNAYRDGKLKKPATCEGCGIVTWNLDKHHPDHSEPLQVQWLCKPCHGKTWRKDK